MKCLKNKQTGNIIRVDDKQAYQMAGSTWQYVSKSEWKAVTRSPKAEEVKEEPTEKVKSKKQLRKEKSEA